MALHFLEDFHDKQLQEFFRRNKTEILLSIMEEPQTFIMMLRDQELIREDKYKKLIRMRRNNMKTGLYDELDGMEQQGPQRIRLFWECVFKDSILSHYPKLITLRNSLMDGSFQFRKLPENVEKEEKQGKKQRKRQRTGSIAGEEEQPRASTPSTPGQRKRKNPIYSSPLKKGDKKVQIPVTCGDKEGTLNRAKLAKGEKCIVVQNKWFTPTEFEEFGGRKAYRNWKFSIRCQNTTLSKLLLSGYLTCPGYNKGAKKTRKSLIPLNQSEDSDRAPSRSSGAGPHLHLRPTPSSPELYQESLDPDMLEYRYVYEVPDTPPAVQTPPRYSHAAGRASAINIPPNSSLRYPQQQYLSPASTSDSPPNSGEGDQEQSRDEEPGCSHDTGDKRVFNVTVESSDRPNPATMMTPRTLSTYQGRNVKPLEKRNRRHIIAPYVKPPNGPPHYG